MGRDGGFTAAAADACIVIPPLFDDRITPHTEGLCAILWHLVVTHPVLMTTATKWEAIEEWSPPASNRSTCLESRELVAVGEAGNRGALGEQPRQVRVSEISPVPYHLHIK